MLLFGGSMNRYACLVVACLLFTLSINADSILNKKQQLIGQRMHTALDILELKYPYYITRFNAYAKDHKLAYAQYFVHSAYPEPDALPVLFHFMPEYVRENHSEYQKFRKVFTPEFLKHPMEGEAMLALLVADLSLTTLECYYIAAIRHMLSTIYNAREYNFIEHKRDTLTLLECFFDFCNFIDKKIQNPSFIFKTNSN